MKRFFTIAIIALFFIACSEESKVNDPTLLHKWYYESVTINGVTNTEEVEGCDRGFMEFTENLWQTTIHSKNEENECAVTSSITEYEVIDLAIYEDSVPAPLYEIISLSENELVLHYLQATDIDGDGELDDVTYTFSRI